MAARVTTEQPAGRAADGGGIRRRAEHDLAGAIEGLGVFYLGMRLDETGGPAGEPLLLDARRFTTHAVCVGMTGSGKTGPARGADRGGGPRRDPDARHRPEGRPRQRPALVSRPRRGRLPALGRSRGRPPRRASRSRSSPPAPPRSGPTAWRGRGQSAERIRRLHEAAEMTVYTPGSRSGTPLAMLGSLDAPPPGDPRRSRGPPGADRVARLGHSGAGRDRRRAGHQPRPCAALDDRRASLAERPEGRLRHARPHDPARRRSTGSAFSIWKTSIPPATASNWPRGSTPSPPPPASRPGSRASRSTWAGCSGRPSGKPRVARRLDRPSGRSPADGLRRRSWPGRRSRGCGRKGAPPRCGRCF